MLRWAANSKSFKCKNYCNEVKQLQILFYLTTSSVSSNPILLKTESWIECFVFLSRWGQSSSLFWIGLHGSIHFFHQFIFLSATLSFPSLLQFRQNKIIWTAKYEAVQSQAFHHSGTLDIFTSKESLMRWCVACDWSKKETSQNLFNNYISLRRKKLNFFRPNAVVKHSTVVRGRWAASVAAAVVRG